MVRFLAMLAVAATAVAVSNDTLSAARSRARLVGSEPSVLSISVFAPRDITDSLLIRVFDEAKAIWEPTGIVLDWHRITSDIIVPVRVTVTIDDDRTGVAERGDALGWILFTEDGPEPSIHLARANTEAVIRRAASVDDETVLGNEILM